MTHFEEGDEYDEEVVDRFNRLPRSVRRLLSKMDDEDVDDFAEMFKWFRGIRAGSRIAKYLWFTLVAAFFGGVALWESIEKAAGWIKNLLTRP